MLIGDELGEALVELQAQAESTMVTPCRISRPAKVTSDPVTGADVPVAGARVFSGRCKIQTREGQARDVESGEGSVTIQVYEVHVPVQSGPYKVGDVVEILDRDDSPAAGVVRRFRVEGLHTKTWQTAQRLPVVETPSVALT